LEWSTISNDNDLKGFKVTWTLSKKIMLLGSCFWQPFGLIPTKICLTQCFGEILIQFHSFHFFKVETTRIAKVSKMLKFWIYEFKKGYNNKYLECICNWIYIAKPIARGTLLSASQIIGNNALLSLSLYLRSQYDILWASLMQWLKQSRGWTKVKVVKWCQKRWSWPILGSNS